MKCAVEAVGLCLAVMYATIFAFRVTAIDAKFIAALICAVILASTTGIGYMAWSIKRKIKKGKSE